MLEYQTASNFLTEAISLLRRSGFNISIERDMGGWRDLLLADPNIPMVNPSFDPEHCRICPGQVFWVGIHDAGGIVAAIANRHFESQNFRDEYLITSRVHFDTPTLEMPITSDTAEEIWSGSIGHSGGLWVHRRARKQGLSWLLPRMCRALSIQKWDVDRHVGMCFEPIWRAGFPTRVYGFPEDQVWLLSDGVHPVVRKPAKIYVFHMDRAAIIGQFRRELDIFERARDKQLRDIAFVVGQRQNQAPKAKQAIGEER